MTNIKEKELLENDFKEISTDIIFSKHADKAYQKRVLENGITKYFINCYAYNFNDSIDYEFEIYTELKGVAVQLLYYGISNKITLTDLLRLIDDNFNKSGYTYYESRT